MNILRKLRVAFLRGTPFVAIVLFGMAMTAMLVSAVLQYKMRGDWVYLAIWFAGMALFTFAIWPIRKRLLGLL